jgi:hypothetical protein
MGLALVQTPRMDILPRLGYRIYVYANHPGAHEQSARAAQSSDGSYIRPADLDLLSHRALQFAVRVVRLVEGGRRRRFDAGRDSLTDQLPALRTRLVISSGGEPTSRRDVYTIAALFRGRGVKLHLLTSGLSLERDAAAIVEHSEQVNISLDGHTAARYEQIGE